MGCPLPKRKTKMFPAVGRDELWRSGRDKYERGPATLSLWLNAAAPIARLKG